MSDHQDETRPATPEPHAEPPALDIPARDKAAGTSASPTVWLLTLAGAVLVGLASWLVGEATLGHFQPSEEASAQLYNFDALNRETAVANSRNGAVAFGTLGGLLGVALGLAGGLTRRSPRGGLAAAGVGLVAGAAAGVLASYVIMPWHWAQRNEDPATLNLLGPLLIHAGLWCGIGLAAGLAYGLGRFGARPWRLAEAALGGLVGAAVAALVYEIVGALAFPLSRTAEPIAVYHAARLLAYLSVTIFVTLGVLFAFRPTSPRRTPGKRTA